MNKRILSIMVAIFAAFLASGSAFAQRGGGGGGHSGGGGGGHSGGGGYSGGGGHSGGGSGWHGGGGGSGYHGGGSGWHGGYSGWHGGYRGGYYGGYRGYGWGWYGAGLATGLYLGGPLWWGAWPYYGAYNDPYYSAAYSYPVYTDPPVYEQVAPQAAPANSFWYYCTEPAGYYPYVQNCSRAWMQVVPQYQPGQGAPNMPAQ